MMMMMMVMVMDVAASFDLERKSVMDGAASFDLEEKQYRWCDLLTSKFFLVPLRSSQERGKMVSFQEGGRCGMKRPIGKDFHSLQIIMYLFVDRTVIREYENLSAKRRIYRGK